MDGVLLKYQFSTSYLGSMFIFKITQRVAMLIFPIATLDYGDNEVASYRKGHVRYPCSVELGATTEGWHELKA